MPKVTIFTQAYNTEDYIVRCIESVLNQTLDDFEYIIVDNGSTDGTKKIIQDYAKQDGRIRAIRFEDNIRGFWPGFVKKEAKGEYFTNLDSDDWIENDFLEVLIRFMEREKIDIAVAGSCFHYEEIGKKGYRKIDSELTIDQSTMTYHFGVLYQFLRTVWGKVFRMNIIKEIEFSDFEEIYKTGYGGDTVYCFDALELTNHIGITDKVLHHYLVRRRSTSSMFNNNRVKSDVFLFKKAENYLKKFGEISVENYSVVYLVYMNAMIDSLEVVLRSNLSNADKIVEINRILKENLSRLVIGAIHESERLNTTKVKIMQLVFEINTQLLTKEIPIETVVDLLLLLNNNYKEFVNTQTIKLYLKEKNFLVETISFDNKSLFKTSINLLEDELLGEVLWESIKEIFSKYTLLGWIDSKSFVVRYREFIFELFEYKNVFALEKMYHYISRNKEVQDEEKLLFLFVNTAAYVENEEFFIYAKKIQCDYYLKNKKYEEAKIVLGDLMDMCPDDEDVINFKNVWEGSMYE
ncbi:glycosyltransferase family 2 protein [Marinisporobacter balticus]|uniref:Glycosyltransferase involved in cell wall biosynthesis n=1 Tax=Marinisporobacter balticus TaxID=2018667 RepID=A0A4R2KRR4_9FIRM|nr:glycosyltransferase family 2 protein [Marinisporobacter balticus]TCO76453.1 glycosyltransferase involved in cell wall biosynthesis [Marinisporobacter balticus]